VRTLEQSLRLKMNTQQSKATAPGTAPEITYTNPTMERRIEGWPMGRQKRAIAVFSIEQHPTRGERAVRVLMEENFSRAYAPKKLTFSLKQRIVDGSDGRTYVAALTRSGFVSIMQGDMKFQAEAIFPEDPRFAEVRALFEAPEGWTHVGGATDE
jgi:hypothetical protein